MTEADADAENDTGMARELGVALTVLALAAALWYLLEWL